MISTLDTPPEYREDPSACQAEPRALGAETEKTLSCSGGRRTTPPGALLLQGQHGDVVSCQLAEHLWGCWVLEAERSLAVDYQIWPKSSYFTSLSLCGQRIQMYLSTSPGQERGQMNNQKCLVGYYYSHA